MPFAGKPSISLTTFICSYHGALGEFSVWFLFFKFVLCNRCPSSPSWAILVPLWPIIKHVHVCMSLVFLYLIKPLFSGFFQFQGNFVCSKNNSKYCDWAPLKRGLMQKFLPSCEKRLHLCWLQLKKPFQYICIWTYICNPYNFNCKYM